VLSVLMRCRSVGERGRRFVDASERMVRVVVVGLLDGGGFLGPELMIWRDVVDTAIRLGWRLPTLQLLRRQDQ